MTTKTAEKIPLHVFVVSFETISDVNQKSADSEEGRYCDTMWIGSNRGDHSNGDTVSISKTASS